MRKPPSSPLRPRVKESSRAFESFFGDLSQGSLSIILHGSSIDRHFQGQYVQQHTGHIDPLSG
ncbi:hypothetical protein ColTof3_01528 [Colletotrichum tofieldiae]|nr:hypothetical protein ColTof3_01528 [Colletotrichum tofieldiae]